MKDPDLPPADYNPKAKLPQKPAKVPKHVQRYQEVMARQALEMAGFKPSYARRALDATMDALGAQKIEVVKWHGVIADERAYPDHKTRLQAADQVFKMVPGLYAKQEKATGAANVTVEIVTLAPDGTKHAIRVGEPVVRGSCSNCTQPPRPHQRYCLDCHAQYMRAYRRARVSVPRAALAERDEKWGTYSG